MHCCALVTLAGPSASTTSVAKSLSLTGAAGARERKRTITGRRLGCATKRWRISRTVNLHKMSCERRRPLIREPGARAPASSIAQTGCVTHMRRRSEEGPIGRSGAPAGNDHTLATIITGLR
jgi:hypothetical protein